MCASCLNITVAMVPPKSVRQIEPGCRRALKAEVCSERMEQWKSLKYETVLTEQTFFSNMQSNSNMQWNLQLSGTTLLGPGRGLLASTRRS